MNYDFAPLEGLTDSIYRRVHHSHFSGIDRYYMPFFSPTMHRTLTGREDRELPSADSVDFVAVPQVLTKVAVSKTTPSLLVMVTSDSRSPRRLSVMSTVTR